MSKWTYSTYDEVSHLACEDVEVLRDRIDMLIEERKEWKKGVSIAETMLPDELNLTPMEARLLEALMRTPKGSVATKERLHGAMADADEPDTQIKIVDVIVCKVRKKLSARGLKINTHWGRGYSLSPDSRAFLGC